MSQTQSAQNNHALKPVKKKKIYIYIEFCSSSSSSSPLLNFVLCLWIVCMNSWYCRQKTYIYFLFV